MNGCIDCALVPEVTGANISEVPRCKRLRLVKHKDVHILKGDQAGSFVRRGL